MLDRLKQAISEADIREAMESADVDSRLRLSAIIDLYDGQSVALVGHEHEVPSGTILRWLTVFSQSGVMGLLSEEHPVTVLADIDAEVPAQAAKHCPPGVEKTAFRAMAAACRGASVDELSSYFCISSAEVETWIELFRQGGCSALSRKYRRPHWRDHAAKLAAKERRKEVWYAEHAAVIAARAQEKAAAKERRKTAWYAERAANVAERAMNKTARAAEVAKANAPAPLVEMPASWDTKRVIRAVYRAIDTVHRHQLEIVYNIYRTSSNITRVQTRMNIDEQEVRQAADAFVAHGVAMGRPEWAGAMLPKKFDETLLARARKCPEPLRSYAQIVNGLYCGKHPDTIKSMFEISDAELRKIVTAFRKKGVDGLIADPLKVGKPIVVHHGNMQSKVPAPAPKVAPVKQLSVGTLRARDGGPKSASPPRQVKMARPAPAPVAKQNPAEAMFGGKNAYRLEAVKEFELDRNIQAVAAKHNVSTRTLEKWIIAYVSTGQAEKDRTR
jgi:transposase